MFKSRVLMPVTLGFGALLSVSLHAGVTINEVAFDEPAGTPDWVELYNAGPDAVSIDGWRLDDHDTAAGKEILLHLAAPVPPGGVVVVRVDAVGVDDVDPSDGLAVLYTGTHTTVNLAATEDELALYRAPVASTDTLQDFVAWVTDGDYGGSKDQAEAVAAGLWCLGDAVALEDSGHGYSLGRWTEGLDRDRPDDFRAYRQPTPGAPNRPPVPPPSSGRLWIPDDQNPFDPDSPEPERRRVSIGFRAGGERDVKALRLLDRRGRVLRRWIDHDRGDDGRDWTGLAEGLVSWDGSLDDGSRAPLGLYVVVFESASPTGAPRRERALLAVGGRF